MWLQDEVKSARLRVRRVKSEDNLADLGTRELSNKTIRKHATSMVYFDDQDSLESGGVMGLWIDESAWTAKSSQSSSAQKKKVGRVSWWSYQTAAAATAAATAEKGAHPTGKNWRLRYHRAEQSVSMQSTGVLMHVHSMSS